MKTSSRNASFGPYSLDLRSAELRKFGTKVKMGEQTFQILCMLLEAQGELVTREELRSKLWDGNTFVDFDHGLNSAIQRLRDCLSDSAERPCWIETVPRRGYRFIGSVQWSDEGNSSAPISKPSNGSQDARHEVDAAGESEPSPWGAPAAVAQEQKKEEPLPKRTKPRLWAAALGTAALCVVVSLGFVRLSHPLPPRVLAYRQLTADRKIKDRPCEGAHSRLATDGARVFFSEYGSGVAEVSTNGGEVATLTNSLPCFEIYDISPDKTELLGDAWTDPTAPDNPLWVLSVSGGQARRLGNLKGYLGAWSPDGQKIAYATASHYGSGPSELNIAARDGSHERTLVRIESKFIVNLLWSADGNSLRIGLVTPSLSFSVWEVSSDGTNLHLARQVPEAACCPKWTGRTPDGKYVIAQVAQNIWALGETPSLFHKNTHNDAQLTYGPMTFGSPTVSPDGKHIFAIGGRARGELLRYDLNSRKLEPYLSGISAEHLDFSRDGKWVTYVTFPEGTLWRSKVDGSERMQLTTPPLRAVLPRWSPDGTRIVFTGWASGWAKTYLISADGGQPEKLTQQDQEAEVDPTWTPDGNSLVFGGSMYSAQPRISVLDLRTRRVSIVPGSEGLVFPRVSPDGRFIFAETKDGHQLLLFDQQTQKWSALAKDNAPSDAWPQWSGDSKYLYFGRDARPGFFSIYRVRVTDRKIEPVASLQVPEGLIGVWGGWITTAPDGSPLLLRDLSVQEIYALDVELP